MNDNAKADIMDGDEEVDIDNNQGNAEGDIVMAMMLRR